MPLPAQSKLVWHVSMSTLHIIAIASTLIRLIHRRKRLYLWWDDWATIPPLISDVLYFVIMWLKIQQKLTGTLFTSFWIEIMLFLTIIWLSRASLALSIARIFPPRHICRHIAFSLTGLFLFIWVVCLLMDALECYDKSVHEWWNVPLPLCMAKRPTVKGGIYLVTAFDFLADLVLITGPIMMLWSVKLPVGQRRLLFVLFSCSILTLITSVFFVTLGLVPLRLLGPDALLLLDMGGQLQGCISIIICNLMVVATLIYRVSKKKFAPEIKSPPLQKDAAPVVPPRPSIRRGTSIFRDPQPASIVHDLDSRIDNRNGRVMASTADPIFYQNDNDSSAISFTVPSFGYERNPSSQWIQSTESTSG